LQLLELSSNTDVGAGLGAPNAEMLTGKGDQFAKAIRAYTKHQRANSRDKTTDSRERDGLMNTRKLVLVVMGVLALTMLLVGMPASALAARGRVFDSSFGKPGTGEGELSHPQGAAVDEVSGDVYVLDTGNNRVERFSSAGAYLGQFDGSGNFEVEGKSETGTAAPSGAFSGPEAITVDNACEQHKPRLTEATTPTCAEFDPSAGDVYVLDSGNAVIDKFSARGEYISQLTEASTEASLNVPLREISSLAVDADGKLWVSYAGSAGFFGRNIADFNDAVDNEPVATKEVMAGAYLLHGLAVNAQGDLYVNLHGFGSVAFVEKLDASGAVIDETIGENLEEKISGVAVEAVGGALYVDNLTTVSVFSGEGVSVGEFGSGHLTHGSGIAVDGSTGLVYVPDSSTNTVAVFGPAPPTAPTVESESVSNVTASSAELEAQLNPNTLDTTYHFEYGSEDCSLPSADCITIPASDIDIGSGSEGVAVSQHITGLEPGLTYHYRTVAENSLGVTPGPDKTFTAEGLGGALTLPDGRGWEMITPPGKRGGRIVSPYLGDVQASENGEAITYVTRGSIEQEPEGNRFPEPSQSLARHSSTGWGSKEITPPQQTSSPVQTGSEYRIFSSDLSTALVEPRGSGLLSIEATERTPYLRENFAESPDWRPVLTGKTGYADVPPGTQFGGEPGEQLRAGRYAARVFGASPDLHHLVLQSEVALAEGAPSGAIYEWGGGALQLVSLLPAEEGGAATEGTLGSAGSFIGGTVLHAVSEDGRYVYWSNSSKTALYVRDAAASETVRLDVVQSGATGAGPAGPVFVGAAADGTHAFFTDTQQLSEGAGTSGADLYECDLVEQGGKPQCDLHDLTAAAGGEAADVQGVASGMSEDASYVYFVANGVLGNGAADGAVPGDCQVKTGKGQFGSGDTCNLYVVHDDGTSWTTTYVAQLSGDDENDWGGAVDGAADLSASSSPSGHYFTFMSDRSLTGYDNRDAVSGAADEEVFLYDSNTEMLSCLSCDPTGARPVGVLDEGASARDAVGAVVDWADIWSNRWLAANLPDPTTPETAFSSFYRPRVVLDDGRVFFNAADSLAPADANGVPDAYQYEPVGVGSCTASSGGASVSRVGDGCVALISSGTSGKESGVIDASASGEDVFFLTAAQLSDRDTDAGYDMYDAHVCGSGWQCPAALASPPPCTTADSCRAAPEPQPAIFGAPPSATFSGAGNLTPTAPKAVVQRKAKPPTRAQKLAKALKVCKKKPRRERAACKTQAKRKYARKANTKRAKKSNNGRGSK
jgi:DNA-binding beta-propeller fold protein YncE